MKKIFVLMAVSLLVTAAAFAEENKTETPQSSGSRISDGKAFGEWWQKRVLKFDKIPDEILYHFEAAYSYSELTGNEIERKHQIGANLWLRKDIVTSLTTYTMQDSTVSAGGMSMDYGKQSLDENIYMEITKNIDIAGGFSWMRDNGRYIENRFSYFAGLYFTVIDSPQYILKIGVYGGLMDMTYMNNDLQQMGIPYIPEYHTQNGFIIEKFTWNITSSLSLSQTASYVADFKSSDLYRWKFNINLNYLITQNIFVYEQYDIDYYVTQISQMFGTESKCTALSAGIKIMF